MIYTSNLVVTGEMQNVAALYANNISASDLSNITIKSDTRVQGNFAHTGRIDTGSTIFALFRLNSNRQFGPGISEIYGNSNFVMDFQSTDMSSMAGMQMAVSPGQVFNYNTGVVTLPVSGLYSLFMQGSFSNNPNNALYDNGVYYRFLNFAHSNARIAASISDFTPIHHTNYVGYFLAGDKIQPTFYSEDPEAILLGGTGETMVGFSVISTVTPTHSNYYRTS
jgi:hypothetical protein